MDYPGRLDGELVKRLRREKGWTQAELARQTGSVSVGWVRKVEARKPVRLEWSHDSGSANAGEDLAVALGVKLDTLILDSLDGDKIKRLREQRNQSCEELAKHADTSVEVVRMAEEGRPVHRVDTRLLATAFDVPPFDLLLMGKAKGLNFDAEGSWVNLQAGMVYLGLSIQRRAEWWRQPVPADDVVRMEAHARLMYAIWKLGKDLGTEASPRSGNSPYILAMETVIGSEVAAQIRVEPDSYSVVHAKRLASGLDERMLSALQRCELITLYALNQWIERQGVELKWGAPDADLPTLCSVGSASMGHAMLSNASGKSMKHLKACAKEATSRIDFLCVFISRYYPYFSALSANDHGEFIRLATVFLVACYAGSMFRQRLPFAEAVKVEQTVEDTMTVLRARVAESSPELKMQRGRR